MFVVGDHGCPVNSLAFAPSGATLAAAGKDGTARLWDLGGGPPVILTDHANAVLSVAFRPDGAQVATGSADRTARLWDAATGRQLSRFPQTGAHEGPVSAVAFLNSGRIFISASGDRINPGKLGEIRQWHSAATYQKLDEPQSTRSLTATTHSKSIA